MSLPGAIDRYLADRGSPMAGYGQSFVRAGRKYGVDPRLLVGISVIESGAGTKMKLRNNAWNWGIYRNQEYDSFDAGINDVARGLRRNYLDEGLDTPQAIVSKYAPSADGNNESNWANVVSEVMTKLGGSGPVNPNPAMVRQAPIPRPPSLPPPVPARPVLNRQALGQDMLNQFVTGGGRIDIMGLPGTVQRHWEMPELQPASPAAPGPIPPTKVPPLPKSGGGFLQLPTRWKSTHVTDGLADKGFTHAVDIMGAPGTGVGAPEEGVVVYFHPTGAQGGGSMEIRTKSGRVYWLGHIADGLPAGTKVKKGQVIAQISSDHPRPHVHLDYTG